MRKKRRSAGDVEINITPMLDIVFILLIFFIVTTSFVRETGVEMNRASSAAQKTVESSEAIFVRIENDGRIFIRNRATDIRLVHANIQASLAALPGAPVIVAAARNSDAGILVRVVDQARVAGAAEVSMVALGESP